jgi:hypothetical protein
MGPVDQDVDDLEEVLDVGLAGWAGLAGVAFGGESVDLAEPVEDIGIEVPGEVFASFGPGGPAVKGRA